LLAVDGYVPMLAVKYLAAHYVKFYSCELYFCAIDLFGVLLIESVTSVSIVYRQPKPPFQGQQMQHDFNHDNDNDDDDNDNDNNGFMMTFLQSSSTFIIC